MSQPMNQLSEGSYDPVFQAAMQEIPAGKLYVTDANLAQEADSGGREVASAAWWGFTLENSHTALQRAFRSKAKTVIVPNIDEKPWQVHTTINIERDDLTILLQGGVVIQTTHIPGNSGRWKYRVTDDLHLLEAVQRSGITIRGESGATPRPKAFIQRETFPNSPPPRRLFHISQESQYGKPSRMALNFRMCDNVNIIGLDTGSFGGDGIYLRDCSNVLVEDVTSDFNMRNGISVISGKNYLITDSRFVQTEEYSRESPAAGMDIEPNPGQRIENCRIIRCHFKGNNWRGLWINLENVPDSAAPVEILISECTMDSRMRNAWALGIHNLREQDSVRIERTNTMGLSWAPIDNDELEFEGGATVRIDGQFISKPFVINGEVKAGSLQLSPSGN